MATELKLMTIRDDRGEFEERKRTQSIALGNDRATFNKALDALYAADNYDYAYLWSWMGVPIIQLPADIMATQEVIWATRPAVIIETGVARGGSVLFMASMLELIGKGMVVGVDVDIRPHNRDSIERHPMAKRVALIEGSSVAPETLALVRQQIPKSASVMVVLGLGSQPRACAGRIARLRAFGVTRLLPRGCRHGAWSH